MKHEVAEPVIMSVSGTSITLDDSVTTQPIREEVSTVSVPKKDTRPSEESTSGKAVKHKVG